jgi:hypothetical protein
VSSAHLQTIIEQLTSSFLITLCDVLSLKSFATV